MVTNGVLLDDRMIARILACGMTAIGVSIDGPEEIHDRIRGTPGAFTAAARNIEHAVKSGIDVTVISSISGLNIGRLDDLLAFASAIGAWKWQLQPLFPLGRGGKDATLSLTEQQFLNLGAFIHAKRPQSLKNGLQIIPADSCGYFSPLDFPELGWNGCGAGRFSCGVMSDGRVKGCLSWPDTMVEGDIRKDSLWKIWFRADAFSALRYVAVDDLKGGCRACDVALECGGGCQAMSLAATGDLHADPYCYRRILGEAGAVT
jgi:radical SAM protein with 4Fe4S-binding SPASM domain